MVTKRGRERGKGERFIRLNHALLKTEAWGSLTCAQRCVYLALCMVYNGFNNGQIGLSVRQAAKLANCNKDTAAAALKTLETRGFIERMTPGAFSLKIRHSALYRLTHLPVEDAPQIPATCDYRTWRPKKSRSE